VPSDAARSVDFAAVVPVSASKGTQVRRPAHAVTPLCRRGPALFENDELTTVSERVLPPTPERKAVPVTGRGSAYGTGPRIERFETQGGLRRIGRDSGHEETARKAWSSQGGEKAQDDGPRCTHDMDACSAAYTCNCG